MFHYALKAVDEFRCPAIFLPWQEQFEQLFYAALLELASEEDKADPFVLFSKYAWFQTSSSNATKHALPHHNYEK